MRLLQLVAVIAWATHTSSCSAAPRPPKVTLDLGAFTGVESGDITEFLGIPFASARRFRLPQAVGLYLGRYDATAFGPSCPQQVSGMPDPITDTSEDCLTINVVKPTQDSRAKLPVVVWIYGGGFQIGGTVQYNGSSIVSRSIQLGEPVIYVSFNYRLSGFGFLASKEVKKAGVGNLGMHDQIMALRWVQRYIDTFGGDPKKVTIWGESAGAISVALHMLVNDGDNRGLFRAGFMQSGSPPAILGLENGQQYYDDVVKKTDCAKSADTLDCLRAVDYNILKEAIDSSAPSLTDFQSFPLAWQPRVDNVLFSDNPQRLVQKGKVANVPIVTGDCDDEGTLFALAQTNLSTDAHFKEWIKKFALPTAPEQEIDRLLELYPADPTQGSPFDTGTDNAITPQFKRFAAFLGDVIFQAPRRFFLEELPKKQDTYAFLSKRSKSVPVMGAFHGSDVELAFSGDMADYLIRFAATLNPNGDTGISWPKWTIESRDMLLFEDGDVPLSITQDTYREEAIKAVVKVFLEHPV